MNPLFKIKDLLKNDVAIKTDGIDNFLYEFKFRGQIIKISIKRSHDFQLPHVDDWVTCPACLRKRRDKIYGNMVLYCQPCKNQKQRLFTKGITKKGMRNKIAEYNHLIGSMCLLKELNTAIKTQTDNEK